MMGTRRRGIRGRYETWDRWVRRFIRGDEWCFGFHCMFVIVTYLPHLDAQDVLYVYVILSLGANVAHPCILSFNIVTILRRRRP